MATNVCSITIIRLLKEPKLIVLNKSEIQPLEKRMKVIFEVAVKEEARKKSSFAWLNNKNNWLFIIEDNKLMKTISIDPDRMKEKQVQSTTVADKRTCTNSAWNRDGSVLAMVLDTRQIYFWEIETNSFTHFTPKNKFSTNPEDRGRKIDLIAWSNVTNKLAICYQTAHILLCDCGLNLREKLIDKSEGVLNRIKTIESAEFLDMFACITIDSELLLMTFDGIMIYYIQLDNSQIQRARFSPVQTPPRSALSLKSGGIYWVVYQSVGNQLHFKQLELQTKSRSEIGRKTDIIYCDQNIEGTLVNFHWLNSNQLILCYSTGLITLVRLTGSVEAKQNLDLKLITEAVLSINKPDEDYDHNKEDNQVFKAFELKRYKRIDTSLQRSSQSTLISLVAISNYKIFYYEQTDEHYAINDKCSFEKVDDLDLSGSLKKVNQQLERADWCFDCSMLAVQLTNGHILVYRTRLQDYLVVSHESRIAYLSGSHELTVLNYGSYRPLWKEQNTKTMTSSSSPPTSPPPAKADEEISDALTMNLEFRPTVVAIGPKHLVVALNNRVRFYSIDNETGGKQKGSLIGEQEHISIVSSLSLNSQFIAIHFQDGRLKLQPTMRHRSHRTGIDDEDHANSQEPRLSSATCTNDDDEVDADDESLDERFFPDPAKPERISSFALTEQLLVYTSQELQLTVFSLALWSIVQVYEHSQLFERPIVRLRPNGWGNKFVCLLSATTTTTTTTATTIKRQVAACELQANNVYLYDLNTNSMISFKENKLYKRMFDDSQLMASVRRHRWLGNDDKTKKETIISWPKLNQVLDAIWDTDGRSLLLIERKRLQIMVVLDHTLEREAPVVEHVYSGQKPASYTTLYASQGIVSFQTAVGRVINSTLDSHNDVERLNKLVTQIKEIKEATEMKGDVAEVVERQHGEVLGLKLDYLRSILPLYSLTKCKEICSHLMSDELFNLVGDGGGSSSSSSHLELMIWKHLASWALYTQNLQFALFIYRKHGLVVYARVLEQIIKDAQLRSLDAKASAKTRLLVLLGCDMGRGFEDGDDDYDDDDVENGNGTEE